MITGRKMDMKDQLKDIPIDQVGLNLQIPQTIGELLKTSRLRGKKQGKRWYIPEGNLQAYFEEEPLENE
jgi:hypothetical protein